MNILTLLADRPFVSEVLLHFILFMFIYIIIRIGYLILKKGKHSTSNEVRYLIGMVYINFVIALTLTPLHLQINWDSIISRIQIIPFDTVTRYWPLDGEYSLYNIVGNFLMMFPMLPILTYAFNVTSIKKATLFTAFFIVAIEIMQLFLTSTRACDIDDFILNFGGFLVSIIIWQMIKSIRVAK